MIPQSLFDTVVQPIQRSLQWIASTLFLAAGTDRSAALEYDPRGTGDYREHDLTPDVYYGAP